MLAYTLHELQCFDAVVTEGSFNAAALKLHRSHPAVHSAVKNLEAQLGLSLLDRAGYRVSLTQEGAAFHKRARLLLSQANAVDDFAALLAQGEESDLRLLIGVVCPFPEVLGLLRQFSALCPQTRLHLQNGALSGPGELLANDEVDLVIHPLDRRDAR
ncbi:MAG: LysR family transcriptional regulator, partial [Pseudomonadota bacterium]